MGILRLIAYNLMPLHVNDSPVACATDFVDDDAPVTGRAFSAVAGFDDCFIELQPVDIPAPAIRSIANAVVVIALISDK